MYKIAAGFEVLDLPDPKDRIGVLKHLEHIGRICYKSEDKITTDSCINFIQRMRDNRHWAMLEHYIFTLSVSKEIFDDITDRMWMNHHNTDLIQALKFINVTEWPESYYHRPMYIVSGSATAFNNLWKCECFFDKPVAGIPKVCQYLKERFPELMMDPWHHNEISDDCEIRFLQRYEVKELPAGLRMLHDFRSVIFTVDRGVSHEIVRHRSASYAMESTRYCNYHSDKFDNNITYILPVFFDTPERDIDKNNWNDACCRAEHTYHDLIKSGCKPQEARAILPHSIKTDLCMTASLAEWLHFFKMRVPKSAHPQMREVAIPLMNYMKTDVNEIFDNLSCLNMNEDLVIKEE